MSDQVKLDPHQVESSWTHIRSRHFRSTSIRVNSSPP